MKYVVMIGYDEKPSGLNCSEYCVGTFDNYLEAYGRAILHLNDVIRDTEDSDAITISPIEFWGDYGYRMKLIGQEDITDYVIIYRVEDFNTDSDRRWKD